MSPSADRPNTDATLIQHRPSTDPTSTQQRASPKYILKWSIEVKALHSTFKEVVVVCRPCVPISDCKPLYLAVYALLFIPVLVY